jgi:hypothetical protein
MQKEESNPGSRPHSLANLMKTTHRFFFPLSAKQAVLELPDFDRYANKGDQVRFEAIPDKFFVITKRTFIVLLDNSVKYIDYVVKQG